MGLNCERELVERALSVYDADDGREAVFPPVARRFLEAREALGLSREDVATAGASRYRCTGISNFTTTSLHRDLRPRPGDSRRHPGHAADPAAVRPEPSPALPAIPYTEVARRLRARINDEGLSADELSEQAGWEVAECLDAPDTLADLPSCGFRSVCGVAGVDWVATLPTGAC